MYSSEDALAAIYKTDSLEAARAEQARTAAQLNAIRAEDLRKTRIPIAIVLQVHDEIFQAIAATLKAAKGKLLTQELINDIFDKFRSIPEWCLGGSLPQIRGFHGFDVATVDTFRFGKWQPFKSHPSESSAPTAPSRR